MNTDTGYEAGFMRRRHRGPTARALAATAAATLAVGLVMAFSDPASGRARPAQPAQTASTERNIAEQVRAGVVIVDVRLRNVNAMAAGTGMVISSGGLVLTNYHVITDFASVTATVAGKIYQASVVGYDKADDIALIRLHGAAGLQTVPVGNSSQVQVGQWTVTEGNANGRNIIAETTGTVTGLNVTVVASDMGGSETLHGMIESNAAIEPGDSGGPLSGSSGVIGMDTAGAGTQHQATSFAIPINTALSVANQITAGKVSSAITIASRSGVRFSSVWVGGE